MIIFLLHAICLWMMADAQGWDLPGEQCSQQPSDVYDDRNEVWSRCHANAVGGGHFALHRPKLDSADDNEMEVVTTIQAHTRTGDRHEMTQICLTWTDGHTECTGGSPDHYEHKPCGDLNLPATHRLHELSVWTNGRHDRVAITSMRIKYSDPAGAGGIQVWNCGRQNYNYYPSEPVRDNPGLYQLAGFYGSVGWWMDQLGAFLYDPPCNIIGREIIDIQCKNPVGGRRRSDGHQRQECAGVWDPTLARAVDVNAICENCDTVGAENLQCNAAFSTTQSHTISVTDTHTDSVGGELSIGASFEFDVKILGFGGGITTESSVSVNYEHSWSSSKTQEDTSTTAVQSTCTQTAGPGTISTLSANVIVGQMTADFLVTYLITTQCGDDEEKQFEAQALMSNVASTEVIQQCSQSVEECIGGEPSFPCQIKINEAWKAKHSFESEAGFPLNMFDKHPYFDTITGTWPNLADKEDFQKYFKCYNTFPVECAGLQFPNTCHSTGLCTECFVIDDDECYWDPSTGGVCDGDKFGDRTDIDAAKAACLLDHHCTRIECDNALPWESACMMCSADLTMSSDSSVTTTVYSPQSDCGNASRSAPGASATDPPTKQLTLLAPSPPPVIKPCTKIEEGKVCAGERADDCKWLKQQKRCISNKVCEAQSKQVCKERADCEYNRVTTTCVDKGTVPCDEYLKAIECKYAEPVGKPLACFFNKDTKKCRDRACGDIKGKNTCKKYPSCMYESGTCKVLAED